MDEKLERILVHIPGELAVAIAALDCPVNEIRMRIGCRLSVTSEGRNIMLAPVVTKEALALTVDRLSLSSLHAHEDTLRDGYITYDGGYRIGVCGSVVRNRGAICALREITSVNIRIPHDIIGVGGRLLERIRRSNYRLSVLVYSPPGVGKTTLLRDLAASLASDGQIRVSVVDSRRELLPREGVPIDHLSGYPKAKGIEIAVRTMNPQYLICDEIGSEEEARAILSVQNSGVPLIAACHASGAGQLYSKPGIRALLDAGVFDICVGITRESGHDGYRFAFTEPNELSGRSM